MEASAWLAGKPSEMVNVCHCTSGVDDTLQSGVYFFVLFITFYFAARSSAICAVIGMVLSVRPSVKSRYNVNKGRR